MTESATTNYLAPESFETAPEGRELNEYAGYLMQLAARFREKALDDALEPLGVNAMRSRVLSILRRLQPCTMGEVAFFSTIDRTTLTRVVDQLTRQGLVQRQTPADDRRKVTLTLTSDGHSLVERATATIQSVNRAVYGDISDEHLQRATGVLRAVLAATVTDPRALEMLLTFSRTEES